MLGSDGSVFITMKTIHNDKNRSFTLNVNQQSSRHSNRVSARICDVKKDFKQTVTKLRHLLERQGIIKIVIVCI